MIGRILLVDLCYKKDSLSRYEFVNPIASILESQGHFVEIMHYSEIIENELENFDKIILCGTALKDNSYATKLELFSWIEPCKKPILGICAGMQVIGALFGGAIQPQSAIGLKKIEIFTNSNLLGEPRTIEGYHLHNFGVTIPEGFMLIAGSPEAVIAFQHDQRQIYGIIFHPEVRNRWILEKFANL